MKQLALFVAVITTNTAYTAEAWKPLPEHFAGATLAGGRWTLDSSKWGGPESNPGRWSFALAPEKGKNIKLAATVTIEQPAKTLGFFGQDWSVWPDPSFGDQGFEFGILCRGDVDPRHAAGYRVQLSHKYQCLALVKYPNGGYVRVVACEVKLKAPHHLEVAAQGNEIIVRFDGKERIRFRDSQIPMMDGQSGIGVSSGAKVIVEEVALQSLPEGKVHPAEVHRPNFAVRPFLGGRPWIFDGDEPILLLPVPEASSINNVKLRPGLKPQLSWNSHWDIANQGAFPEGTNKNSRVTVSGGGASVQARWSARQIKDRFATRTTLTASWDAERSVYRYDIDSELEVLPGAPFHFRYGYDFEHHTPLDPFGWQYLIGQREGGETYHRPVYPIDPGPQNGLEQYQGFRVWYGRHHHEMPVNPAVEYHIDPDANRDPSDAKKLKVRKLNTAVCAAFYDTGVSYEAETAPPGTKVRVKYRYTGYPLDEAKRLFESSKVYASHMLDPQHHYIFADEWPTLTFSQHVPMSQTWIYGRTPFMTAHNQRPTYELATVNDLPGQKGKAFAMKLGPASFGAAQLSPKEPLESGRYVVSAWCKSENAHGPGGRIELTVLEPKTGKPLSESKHYVGNGSFPWKNVGFVFHVPQEGCALKLALGNAGTGSAYFTNVGFHRLEGELSKDIAATPKATAPVTEPSPTGAIADYRMVEGRGLHALDFAGGPFGLLELANLDWVVDEGRPALRFADNTTGRREYPKAGPLERGYLGTPYYDKKSQTLPFALAGLHGGGMEWKAFTIASWIKPAAAMGKAEHGGKGDIVGLGARRFILSLHGAKSPYQLAARLNVEDVLVAPTTIEANRWCHVALSAEATGDKKWRVRLYLDRKLVHEGASRKMLAPTTIPPSLIFGAEIFYLHDAYYRGLIGRTMIFDRALSAEAIAKLP